MWPHFAVFIEMSCILRPCWLLYNSQNSTAGSHQRGNYPWTPCPQNIVFVIFGAPSFLSLASSNVVRNGCYLTCVAYFLINPQVRWYWDFCGNTPPQHFQRQNCSPRFLHSQNSCQSPETSHSQVPSHLQQNHFIFLSLFNFNSSSPSLPTKQLLPTEVEVDLLRREEMHNCTNPEQHWCFCNKFPFISISTTS